MVEPLNFTDRIPELIGAPGALVAETRRLLAGERRITKAANVAAIPVENVRRHVVETILEAIKGLLREPLSQLILKQRDAAMEELELLEGKFIVGMQGENEWIAASHLAIQQALSGGDIERVIGDESVRTLAHQEASNEEIVEAVLDQPIADVGRALRECGVTTADIETLVEEVRSLPPPDKYEAADRRLGEQTTLDEEWDNATPGAPNGAAPEARIAGDLQASAALVKARRKPGRPPNPDKNAPPSPSSVAAAELLAAIKDYTAINEHELSQAIGVSRAQMNNYRMKRAVWTPDEDQIATLRRLYENYVTPLSAALEGLEAALL